MVLLLWSLAASLPAHAGVAIGADGEVTVAIGQDDRGGTGGGGAARVGWALPMWPLGPMGLQLIPEIGASYHQLKRVGGANEMVRATAGARLIFTLLWIRGDRDDEASSARGIRLNTSVVVRGGGGLLDVSEAGVRGTADAQVAAGMGFGPLDIGAHVGVGLLGADRGDTTAWLSVGGNLGLQF